MVRYRFETSSREKSIDVNIQTTSSEEFLQLIIRQIFADKPPSFELELVGALQDDVVVLRRTYTKRFETTKPVKKPRVLVKTKRKRRWRSPEPLLDIVRRRWGRF